jgi:hypothetical protein
MKQRQLGRLRRRWENSIKLDIKEIGWEGRWNLFGSRTRDGVL